MHVLIFGNGVDVRGAHWKHFLQESIERAESGGTCTDARREGNVSDQSETWALVQLSQSVAKISELTMAWGSPQEKTGGEEFLQFRQRTKLFKT